MQYPPPLPFPIGVRRPRAPPPTTPTHTLYVRNLNEQVNPKSKSSCLILEMIKALESLFSSYGRILDVKAKRNIPHRGQAFISYSSQEIADKVMKEFQGYDLFGKKIDIQYAREESFAVSKESGSLLEHKRKREDLKAKRGPKEKKIKSIDESMAHPNSILFVQHLPADIKGEFLESLFKGYFYIFFSLKI